MIHHVFGMSVSKRCSLHLALAAVESARPLIPPSEYPSLPLPFQRMRDEAEVLRPYFELFFRYKAWAKDHNPSDVERMRVLQDQLRGWADYFDTNYPGDPLYDAQRIREFVKQLDELLAGKPLPRVAAIW